MLVQQSEPQLAHLNLDRLYDHPLASTDNGTVIAMQIN